MKKIILIILISIILLCIYFYTELISYNTKGFKDIFNYRLGDCLYNNEFDNYFLKQFYIIYFKDTLAAEYFRMTNKFNDIETLHEIVKNKNTEKPNEDEIIFHIRLGDVIDWEYNDNIDELLEGKKFYDYERCGKKDYLLNYKTIDERIKQFEQKKIIIVGGYHSKGDHSRSEYYLNNIVKYLREKDYNIELRINQKSADEDFIYMASSKNFIKSGGGYSRLIENIVNLNKNKLL